MDGRAGDARASIIFHGAGGRRGLISTLLASTVLCCAGVATISDAYAQTVPAAAAGQSVSFSIPAQPLSSAVNAFIRATGWQISYSSELARGKTSGSVVGTMPPEEALRRLVAGTGVEVRAGASGSAALVASGAGAGSGAVGDGSLLLDVINVTDGSANPANVPFETPGSSSHISAEQLERVPPSSLGDIFKSTPGVIVAGNRVGASIDPNIRGLQGQNRVNVMVDGTRQSAHTYRGYSGSRNETYVDPDFIGGIDISKGPSAGTGGVGAMGGVVNMRILEAHDIVGEGQTYGARVKGSLGSNTKSPQPEGTETIRNGGPEFFNGDSWTGSAVGAMVSDDYELVAGVSRRKSGNYFTGKKGKSSFLDDRVSWTPPVERPLSPFGPGDEIFNTSQDMTSVLVKGRRKWGDGHIFGLSYIFYGNEYGELDENLLVFPGTWGPPPTQLELSETKTHTLKASYAYKPEGNDLVDFSSNLWMTDIRSQSTVMRMAEPDRDDIRAHVRTYGGDVANTSLFDTSVGALTVQNGAEFVFEQARENAGFVVYPWDPDNPDYMGRNPTGDRTLASVFSRSSLDVTDWLTLSGGLRYDYYSTEGKGPAAERYPSMDDGRILPSASVTLKPFDGIQLYGSYVEGWRPPSLRETTAGTTEFLVPNPDLRPELSRNFELGVNILRDNVFLEEDKLRLKAAWFHNTYDDYILRSRPVAPLYTWVNIDKARFTGFEASLQYDTGTFFVEGAFTKYTDIAMCDEPTQWRPERCTLAVGAADYGLMNIPPEYSGSVTAGVRLFDQRLTLGGRAYFFGERYGGYKLLGGGVTQAKVYYANTIVDIFGSYKINDTATFDFSVENIGDRYYLDPMSTGIVPSPGRTIRVGLTAQF